VRVALDAEGNSTAVWRECQNGVCTVQVATRSAGGGSSWSLPQPLATDKTVGDVQLQLDAQGGAVAAWEEGFKDEKDQTSWTVIARTRPVGSGWNQPENVSPSQGSTGGFRLALGSKGEAVAVWATYVQAPCDPLEDDVFEALPDEPWAPQPCENGTTSVHALEGATRPAGGAWTTEPKRVATAPRSSQLRGIELALDAQGDALAVWNRYNGTSSVVQAADYDGTNWSEPVDISPSSEGNYAEEQDMALDAEGNAVVAWQTEYSYDTNSNVVGTTRPAAGSWGRPEFVALPYQHARDPQVAIDAQGNAVAVWHGGGPNSSSSRIQSAIRPPGGTWGQWRDLSAVGRNSAPQLALDREGNALAATWTRNLAGDDTVEVATRSVGAAADLWRAAQRVSASVAGQDAAGPQIALDPMGNAVAAWSSRLGTGPHFLQAAGHDVAGPHLRALGVAEAATAGAPVSVSVSPLDVWSDIGSTEWSFGDGASAVGANASHTYAAPGSYEVTVTSKDTLGHASSAKRTVQVAGPAPGSGPAPGGGGTSTTDAGGTGQPGGLSPGGDIATPARVRPIFARPGSNARQKGRRVIVKVTGRLLKVQGRPCKGRVAVGARTGGRKARHVFQIQKSGKGPCTYRTVFRFRVKKLKRSVHSPSRRLLVRVNSSYKGTKQLTGDRAPSVLKRVIR
jgi:hypothetical protein